MEECRLSDQLNFAPHVVLGPFSFLIRSRNNESVPRELSKAVKEFMRSVKRLEKQIEKLPQGEIPWEETGWGVAVEGKGYTDEERKSMFLKFLNQELAFSRSGAAPYHHARARAERKKREGKAGVLTAVVRFLDARRNLENVLSRINWETVTVAHNPLDQCNN